MYGMQGRKDEVQTTVGTRERKNDEWTWALESRCWSLGQKAAGKREGSAVFQKRELARLIVKRTCRLWTYGVWGSVRCKREMRVKEG